MHISKIFRTFACSLRAERNKNMKLSQEKIDKIKHYSEAGLCISLALVAVLGLIPKIWSIHIPEFVMSIVATCLFLSFAVLLVSSFWTTNEEKEQRKAEIKEALLELQSEEKNKINVAREAEEAECPLIDLNEKQKEAIIKLLQRRITTHEKDSSRFNRSVVYTYLSALKALHKITPVRNSDDIDARRRWIEQITGLYEPRNEWAHFRGDYDDYKRPNKKIQNAVKEIESEMEKFR